MAITIPEQHYIGTVLNRSDNGAKDMLPLAFITPEGTDKAAQKRKGTVDKWVSDNSYNTKRTAAATIDNKVMHGFRLLDSVRHYSSFGSGSTKWRVEDPRGFELEITSPNLMHILSVSVVDQSDILDACIWARNGNENFLLPVTSPLYTEALNFTKVVKKTVSVKDVKAGNLVRLKNGMVVTFYGKFFKFERSYSSKNYETDGKKAFVFVNENNNILTYSGSNVVEILDDKIDDDPLTTINSLNMKAPYRSIYAFSNAGGHSIRYEIKECAPQQNMRGHNVCQFGDEYYTYQYQSFNKSYDLYPIYSGDWVNDHKIIHKPQTNNWMNRYNTNKKTGAEMAMAKCYARKAYFVCAEGEYPLE